MGYIKVWVHLVWSTKLRRPYLTDDIRFRVFEHMRENARQKGIFIDFINGYKDHVHCLISMRNDMSISDTVQKIKGESSFWINKNKLCRAKFEWQSNYWGVSIGEKDLDRVREYIKNQEEHHRKKSFDKEFKLFVEKYGFEEQSPG